MAKGLLLVAFDFSTAHEDEFHDWYDLEHVPERQRVPGFGTFKVSHRAAPVIAGVSRKRTVGHRGAAGGVSENPAGCRA